MKSVVINSDKSIGFIEDYKGHTLLNVREWDPGTAVKPEGVYVLEFSDEPAQEQERRLTEEEDQLFYNAIYKYHVTRNNNWLTNYADKVAARVFGIQEDEDEEA